jgi:hypothetical protein
MLSYWEQGAVRSTPLCDAFPLSVLHLCSCGAYATTLWGGGGVKLSEVAPWRYTCAGFAVWTLP